MKTKKGATLGLGLLSGSWLALVWLLVSASAIAQTIPAAWTNNCAGCHGNGSGYVKPPSISSYYGAILGRSGSPWLDGGVATLRAKLLATAPMNGFVTSSSPNDSDLADILAYLRGARETIVAASPTTFATTSVGASSTITVTITNTRAATVAHAVPTITGTNASDFSITSEVCGGGTRTMAANGGTCVINLRMTPATFGTRTGTLNLSFVDNGVDPTPSATTVSLSGIGSAASFQIAASTLSFTSMVGSPITSSTTLSNIGNANLALTALSFGGVASSDYSLASGNTCTSSTTLTPSGNCTLIVQFLPTTTGVRNATLSITHNGLSSPQVVTLSGTGTAVPAPVIESSAASLSFSNTQVGASSTLTLFVRNSGDAALVFSGLTKSGAATSDFSLGGSCSTSTPMGVSAPACTVSVTFSPSALGTRTATLTISSNASNGSVTIPLSGIGIPVPAPLVSLSSTSMDFGNQTIGGLYPTRSVTLTNSGTAALGITAVSLTGAGFSLVDAASCSGTLAISGQCAMAVQFDPTTAGASYTGTLSVTDTATGSPHQVALSGHGTASAAPVMVWSPSVSSLDFAQVSAGSLSAIQSATLSNQGPGGAMINLVNATGADAAYFTVSLTGCAVGSILLEGHTCQVDVRFAPGTSGDKTAAVQIASTGSSPPTLTAHGIGLAGPSPQLTLSSNSLAFAATAVGARSDVSELRLSSSGSNPLHVSALSVSGPYSLQNTTCPSAPFDLAPGTQCAVSVTFVPSTVGSHSGALSITSDSITSSTTTVALSGQGEAAPKQSSGGCTLIQGDSPRDPTLWLLTLGAGAVLARRRKSH